MRRVSVFLCVAILGGLLAIGAAVGYSLVDNDEKTRADAEAWVSQVLRTATTVDGADVALGRGDATLLGVNISNPPGFSEASAIRIGSISAEGPITRDVTGALVIPRIVIDDPVVTVEGSGGTVNLSRLIKSAETAAARAATANDDRLQRIEIEEVLVLNGTLIAPAASPAQEQQTAAMPDGRRRKIGIETPASSADAMVAVLQVILVSSERAARRLTSTATLDALREAATALDAP